MGREIPGMGRSAWAAIRGWQPAFRGLDCGNSAGLTISRGGRRTNNVSYGAGSRRLRALREASGLNAIEWAMRVGCPVGTVVRAEMGLQVPRKSGDRARMAAAYGLSIREFLRMALDAADDHERRA